VAATAVTGRGSSSLPVEMPAAPEVRRSVGRAGRGRDSVYVKLFEQAIGAALEDAGWHTVTPFSADRIGVAGSTTMGDGQVECWVQAARGGNATARARDFGGIVHNSGVGRAAISFDLRGPQLLCMHGDILQLSAVQIDLDRADAMVVCAGDDPTRLLLPQPAPDRATAATGRALVLERWTAGSERSSYGTLDELRFASRSMLGAVDVVSVWSVSEGRRRRRHAPG